MRAKDFYDIEPGDKILMDIPGAGLMQFEVETINEEDHGVQCKNNIVTFHPNEDDQFIVVD